MRFLVVDDHTTVRRGVRELLLDAYVDAVVDEAGTAADALERVRSTDYDLVTLDISMPDAHGLELLERSLRARPGLRVLMLSMHAASQFAARCLRAGASGYLTKDHAEEELLGAIARVMSGRRYVSPLVLDEVVAGILDDAPGLPHERLSAREFRVLCMIGAGRPLTDIARALAISPKTVTTYRARVLDKMGLGSNADLVRYCTLHALPVGEP